MLQRVFPSRQTAIEAEFTKLDDDHSGDLTLNEFRVALCQPQMMIVPLLREPRSVRVRSLRSLTQHVSERRSEQSSFREKQGFSRCCVMKDGNRAFGCLFFYGEWSME